MKSTISENNESKGNRPKEYKNQCTLYSLANAIHILNKDLTKEKIFSKIQELTSIPFHKTPLFDIAKEKNLKAPINTSSEGGANIIQWIKSEEGNTLLKFVNPYLKDLNIQVSFAQTENDKYQQYIDILNSGEAILVPCTVEEENGERYKHHITLFKGTEENFNVIDINISEVLQYSNDELKTILDEERKIQYKPNATIEVNNDPLIIISKVIE